MKEKQIKQLRKYFSLSQEEFARIVGVTLATISRWERGISEPRGLAIDKLVLITSVAERGRLIFGNNANKWFNCPNKDLQNQKPIKAIETFEGIEAVNIILTREVFKIAREGLIPWHIEGFTKDLETMPEWYSEEGKKAWSKERIVVLDEKRKKTSEIRFNIKSPEYKEAQHFFKNYGKNLGTIHNMRFFNIKRFLIKNKQKLKKEGLIREGEETIEIREKLLEILLKSPFVRLKEENGEWEFDYNKIIKDMKKEKSR